MGKLILWFTSIAAIISVLASMVVIGALIWYAIYGNPAADIGHFIKEVRSATR